MHSDSVTAYKVKGAQELLGPMLLMHVWLLEQVADLRNVESWCLVG